MRAQDRSVKSNQAEVIFAHDFDVRYVCSGTLNPHSINAHGHHAHRAHFTGALYQCTLLCSSWCIVVSGHVAICFYNVIAMHYRGRSRRQSSFTKINSEVSACVRCIKLTRALWAGKNCAIDVNAVCAGRPCSALMVCVVIMRYARTLIKNPMRK